MHNVSAEILLAVEKFYNKDEMKSQFSTFSKFVQSNLQHFQEKDFNIKNVSIHVPTLSSQNFHIQTFLRNKVILLIFKQLWLCHFLYALNMYGMFFLKY